jgi:hypothetical protein
VTVNGSPLPPDPGCFWHGEEPIPEGVYRVCLECGHAFATREEIMAEHRREYAEACRDSEPLPDDVAGRYADTFCPLCIHDF